MMNSALRMKDEPLVSIIIPFYNRNNLVIDAIKRVSEQTYANIEVILVDDGSEVPLEIVNNYGLNIQLKRFDLNRGPGYARREGRRLAKGEYICYLDSDDWWSNNFIEECVKTIQSDPNIGMVYTNSNTIKNQEIIDRRVKEFKPEYILPNLFIYNKRFWSTTSCLWRSDVSIPENWKDYRNHEDYIHDILSSKRNNYIKYVENALTFKNQSAPNRILRDSEEVRKAINEIIKIKEIPNKEGLSYFFLNRIYKNKLKISVRDLPKTLTLPSREFRIFSQKWFLFHQLVILNMLGIKYKFQKRNIKKLK